MNKHGMLGIIVVLSIAMLGATIVVSYGALQAEATKKGVTVIWCYSSIFGTVRCDFSNRGDCTKANNDDNTAASGCFKKKFD